MLYIYVYANEVFNAKNCYYDKTTSCIHNVK